MKRRKKNATFDFEVSEGFGLAGKVDLIQTKTTLKVIFFS